MKTIGTKVSEAVKGYLAQQAVIYGYGEKLSDFLGDYLTKSSISNGQVEKIMKIKIPDPADEFFPTGENARNTINSGVVWTVILPRKKKKTKYTNLSKFCKEWWEANQEVCRGEFLNHGTWEKLMESMKADFTNKPKTDRGKEKQEKRRQLQPRIVEKVYTGTDSLGRKCIRSMKPYQDKGGIVELLEDRPKKKTKKKKEKKKEEKKKLGLKKPEEKVIFNPNPEPAARIVPKQKTLPLDDDYYKQPKQPLDDWDITPV